MYLVLSNLPALEQIIEIGKGDGFSGGVTENIVYKLGRGGTLDAYLSDTVQYASPLPVGASEAGGMDLHLSFDSEELFQGTNPYAVIGSDAAITVKTPVRGRGAGAFQFNSKGIILRPERGALLYPGKTIRDFTLEFWLYPATMGDGETVFLWEGTTRHKGELIQQEARVFIRGRKLVFRFVNFFMPPERTPYTLELESSQTLIPRTWGHHLISFEGETGLVEYLADGKPDAVAYANESLRETGSVNFPYTGNTEGASLTIGKGFTGLIDELVLRRGDGGTGSLRKYEKGARGSLKTAIYDLEFVDSRLLSVDASFKTPGETGIFFYFRMANEKISREDLKTEWIPFEPGKSLPEATGRYLQFLFELYPDGKGDDSPVLSDVTVTYEPDLPPLPPSGVRVKAQDSSVVLSWNAVSDPDVKGYLVFYGDEPGQYFGEGAAEGSSPIDAGNKTAITLTGLQNGSLYYFSVMAYDGSLPPQRSGFSREVSARPSRLYGGR